MYLRHINKTLAKSILKIGLLILCIQVASTVMAQQAIPSNLDIVAVNVTPQDDGVDLDVYFTARDSQRRPIDTQSAIEPVLIQLPDIGQTVPAVLEKPQTPIYISLVIDASGSMGPAIEDVKRAAESAIDRAPNNAFFRVIQFNETATARTSGFTDDRSFVKNAIRQIQVENRGTCIYDTLYSEIENLKQQAPNPQDRRAIILFTDGKDQREIGSNVPCSFRPLSDVLNLANTPGLRTPIHTIGLAAPGTEENIDTGELSQIALQTLAFSATGRADQLGELFSTIMQDLNSQWVARVRVLAAEGNNTALLKLEEHNVAESFSFTSTEEYTAKLPFFISPPQWHDYREDEDAYVIPLAVSGGDEGMQISYIVTKNSQRVGGDTISWNPSIREIVIRGSEIKDGFEAEAEYLVQFQAADLAGSQILNEDNGPVLAEHVFTHEAEDIPLQFIIDGVDKPDYDAGVLTLHLTVTDPNRVQSYQVDIKDGETGEFIDRGTPYLFTGGVISATLPTQIQEATESKNYPIIVTLYTADGRATEATYNDFKPEPQEPCGFFCIIFQSLANNLIIVFLILVIIGMVVYYVWSQRQQQVAPVRSIPVPSHRHTAMHRPIPATPKVRKPTVAPEHDWEDDFADLEEMPPVQLTIMKTNKTIKIKKYPYVIGRSSKADYKITGDRTVSREHLSLDHKDGNVVLTILSGSGALIGGDIKEKGETIALDNQPIMCMLGTGVKIRLELIS